MLVNPQLDRFFKISRPEFYTTCNNDVSVRVDTDLYLYLSLLLTILIKAVYFYCRIFIRSK